MNFKYCTGDVTFARSFRYWIGIRRGRRARLRCVNARLPPRARRMGNGNFHRGSFAGAGAAPPSPLVISLPATSLRFHGYRSPFTEFFAIRSILLQSLHL